MLNKINISELKQILLKLPFYKAIDLFEKQVNLNEAYQLFLECALKGNVIAIPYVKHLHDYPADQMKLDNNIITRYLDYWYNNLPIIENVDPKYWLQVSLHKIFLNNNQNLTKDQKLIILNDLYSWATVCGSAYILLQDVWIGHYLPKITITKSFQSLKYLEPKIHDLYMLVYLANDKQYNHPSLISKHYEFNLNLIYKKLSLDINKYKYNGILELEISEAKYYQYLSEQFLERKFQWHIISMLMGNIKFYYKFSRMYKQIDLDNRINLALFSGLYGNLLYKAIIGRSLCRLNNIQGIFIVKNFIFGCTTIPENIKNVKLGDEWLASYSDLSIEQLRFEVNVLCENLKNYEKMVSQIYVDCGKLLEMLIEENLINEPYNTLYEQRTVLSCYQRAANLGNIYGLYCTGIFYENNPLKNFEKSSNLSIAYHEKAFKLGCNLSVNRLIIVNYHLKNYEKSYEYLNILMNDNLMNSNINITTTNDYVPVVYANLLINGYAGIVVNEKLAYRIFLDSAYYGNNFAILEIIKDFVSDHKIDIYFKYSHEILLNMANKLYKSFKEEDFIEENSINYLIMFFSAEPYVNIEFAKKLIDQGLTENNSSVIMLIAEYYLYGNSNLEIKQDVDVAIKYYQQLLSKDEHLSEEHKNNMFNLLGLALTIKGENHSEYLELAEKYLLESHENGVNYAGYNLSCLYFKLGKFEKSFELLKLEIIKRPIDTDVLCDIGIHYLYGAGVDKDLQIAKEYMNKAFNLGGKRVLPNLIILKLLEAFWYDKSINFKELMQYKQLLMEYISSMELNNHNNIAKNSVYLLGYAIALMHEPFQYTSVIKKLEAIFPMDYRIEFVLEYFKNKPKDKDINELGVDLLLILISIECKSKEQLEIKFRNELPLLEGKKVDFNVENENNNWDHKIIRFKQRLNNFVNQDPKGKVSFRDFKQLCITASKLLKKQTNCKISHASHGSGEKIEFKPYDEGNRQVLCFHPEHRNGRSINLNDKHDPKRTKNIKQHARMLQIMVNKFDFDLYYNFSL